jgi:hypothetical protein
VIVEALVFHAQQRIDEFRVDPVKVAGKPPATVRRRKGPERLAFPVGNEGGNAPRPFEGRGEETIRQDHREKQREEANE